MKLTHHDDRTWTLSGLTDDEVQHLAAALGSQAALEARLADRGGSAPSWVTAADAAYFAQQQQATGRLQRWLDGLTRWSSDTKLARRRSATYVAAEPEQGVSRCGCGSKYWENGRCVDCGERWAAA
jgi:hypothetical protein